MSEPRITPEQRVEQYFMTHTPTECAAMLDRVSLIMRTRQLPTPAPKLGRPPRPRKKPPIAVSEVNA